MFDCLSADCLRGGELGLASELVESVDNGEMVDGDVDEEDDADDGK